MNRIVQVLTLACFLTASALGQEASAPTPAAATSAAPASAEKKGPAPPRQIRFSGVVAKGDGAPASGDAVALTFSLYETQLGESPLWAETQSVTLDAAGRYNVLLGATSNEGLPLTLFAQGEARWIGVRVADGNTAEQPRVQLVSVPYALAAGDAQTLGGRPVADFALTKSARLASGQTAGGDGQAPGPVTSGVVSTVAATTVNRVAKFIGVDILGDSQIFDNGTNVGIGTTSPSDKLHVVGNIRATGSLNSPQLNSGTAGAALAVKANDGTGTGGALTLSAGNAGGSSGGAGGDLTLTAGSAVPQGGVGYTNQGPAGKVSITAGTGYNGVGGDVTIKSATNSPWTLALNSFSKVSLEGGTLVAGDGATINVEGGHNQSTTGANNSSGGNVTITGGNASGAFAGGNILLNPGSGSPAGNVGIGLISPTEKLHVTGNIKASGTITGLNFSGTGLFALPATTNSTTGVITSGGNRFIHNFGSLNTFVGVNAGNFSMTGGSNTGSGASALQNNTTGFNNTATGYNSLLSNTTGYYNTASGSYTLTANTSGFYNTATGVGALYVNTIGSQNAAHGRDSLLSNTTGTQNTASGGAALVNNTTGGNNTAVGYQAGVTGTSANANTTGSNNTFLGYNSGPGTPTQLTNATAIGSGALVSQSNSLVLGNAVNVGIGTATPATRLDVVGSIQASANLNLAATTGSTVGVITSGGLPFIHHFGTNNTFAGVNAGNFTMTGVGGNTALGEQALLANTTGSGNVALGNQALLSNTTGSSNTAIGPQTMQNTTTGLYNTAVGASALFFNTTGFNNIALGPYTMYNNTTGSGNTALGNEALNLNTGGLNNTALGFKAGRTLTDANANTTGSNNTFIGVNSGPGTTTQLTNATAIGANALVSASNSLVLGNGVNVGIGTSTPDSLLQVKNFADDGATVRIGGNNTTLIDKRILIGDGEYISIGEDPSNDDRLLINAAQGVSIGSLFGAGLDVAGNISSGGNITAVSFFGDGSGLTGLTGAQTGSVNTFTAAQTFNATINLPATTSSTVGVVNSGGSSFIHNFGTENTFVGVAAGNFTMTGSQNAATGFEALFNNTTGVQNVASGFRALRNNTSGVSNAAYGGNALLFNTTGGNNIAIGGAALAGNTIGSNNTATGVNALNSNSAGDNNTADGINALLNNTTGSNNTAVGLSAGRTANPANANTTGSNNTFLGSNSGPGTSTQLTNATAVGAGALVSASNSLVLGDSAVNVGIGTTTPSQKLHVVGNVLASGSVTAGSFVGNGSGLTGLSGAQTGSVNTFTAIQNFNATLNMAATTGAAAGVITSGGSRFLHNYGTQNIFTGVNAGNFTMTGTGNTATGFAALTSNTTGGANTAHGLQTLVSNTIGYNNTAMGGQVLLTNTAGAANTGTGAAALFGNTTGNSNTATGTQALYSNTSGSNNTALGALAGYTATPANANTTGNNNTFIGYRAGPGTSSPLSNATAIGANALVSQNNSIILGDGTVRVGMGTSTPNFQIDIQNTDTAAAGANLFRIQTPSVNGATMHFISTSANGRHWGFGSNFILGNGEFGIYDYNAAAARLWIDAAGNIGLGTNSPSQRLQVAGTVYSTSGGFKFPDGTVQTTAASGGGGGGGDITGVTAGDGLTGGGLSGDVALQVSSNVARKDINNNFSVGQNITGTVFITGNASVSGTMIKGAGSFKIDHPQDPAGKYLSHSFVESPDMKNVYDGLVTLDKQGEAWIELPGYFQALNRDFRYQLTCVGGYAPVYVSQKVANNRFKISGGKPGLEISWQVTGIRQDAYANAHRIPNAEDKVGAERGTYIHPELFPAPAPASARESESISSGNKSEPRNK